MLVLVAYAAAVAWWRIGGSVHRMAPWEGFAAPADWHTFDDHAEGAWMNAGFAGGIAAAMVALALRPGWGLAAAIPAIGVGIIGLLAAWFERPWTELELSQGGRSYVAALEAMVLIGVVAVIVEVLCLRACASSSHSRSWPRAAAVTRAIPRSRPR